MLAIVEPGDLDEVLAICERWEVRADGRRARSPTGGRAAHPRRLGRRGPGRRARPSSLHDDAPLLRPPAGSARRAGRRGHPHADRRPRPPTDCRRRPARPARPTPRGCGRQYDHQLFLNTVERPGRRRHRAAPEAPASRATTPAGASPSPPTATTAGAQSTPGRARPWSWPSPCSTWPASGPARWPLVNCLNFGNPEHPEVMWQLSEAIDGMAEACSAFGVPVVGGNVSLYNESQGADIDPTPVVGLLGVVDDLDRRPPGRRPGRRAAACCCSAPEPEALGGSALGLATRGHRGGDLPGARPRAAPAVADVVRTLVAGGLRRRRARRRPAAASAWPWPRWPCASGVGVTVGPASPTTAELFSESAVAGRALRGPRPARHGRERARAEAGRARPAARRRRRRPAVGQGPASTSPLAEVAGTWRDRLPDALGAGARCRTRRPPAESADRGAGPGTMAR